MDAGAFDHDGAIMVQVGAVEDGAGRDRMLVRSAHRVRVTFCRWRGWSTSVPSRCAKRMSHGIEALDEADGVGLR